MKLSILGEECEVILEIDDGVHAWVEWGGVRFYGSDTTIERAIRRAQSQALFEIKKHDLRSER